MTRRLGGEAFHLVAVPYQGQLVPGQALFEQHRRRRARPLEYALRSDGGWQEDEFFAAAAHLPAAFPFSALRESETFAEHDFHQDATGGLLTSI